MKLITRKSEVKKHLIPCLQAYQTSGVNVCVEEVNKQLLQHKIKFPLLEFCATELYTDIVAQEQIAFCDSIQALKTEGGNVLLGIILQKRLANHFKESIEKAAEYISDADIWYVCDIIGERVYGYSLLHKPEKTIPEIKKLAKHPSNWVIRSLGAGIHYAIKKGLQKKYVHTLFELLITKTDTHDKEVRQGVGWAAKTTARFHPDIIEAYKDEVQFNQAIPNWFRTKIEIGLNRNNYAKRNRG